MSKNLSRISLVIFLLGLVLRKTGIGLTGSIVFNAGWILVLISFFSKTFSDVTRLWRILFALFFFLSVALLQYWIPLGIPSAIFFSTWIVFSILSLKEIRRSRYRLLIWIYVTFVFVSSVIHNPRQFHNLYRATTYEQFIRGKYTEQENEIADIYIDKYKNVDAEKAKALLKEAFLADSLKDYERALELYNRSIDINPDDAIAYHRRGYLKLNQLELDFDMAYSAVKDFDRAIKLDSTFTEAFFHRGLATSYLNLKYRSYLDMKRVWETDSTLTEKDFQKKYGLSKESFSIPFHP